MSEALWKKFSREEIVDILSNSANISELTQNLGYHTRNGNTRKEIDKMLEFHGLQLPDYENSKMLNASMIEERICKICGKSFMITRRCQQTRRYCFECSPVSNSPTFKVNAMKREVIALKGGKCERCGYNKCIDALEFHHLDPSQKDMKLANSGTAPSFEKYLEEAEKCILLCANCHREEHWRLRNEQREKLNA